LWNLSFYNHFCQLILSEETCEKRYEDLDEEMQELLRGAFTVQANVSSPKCEGGADMDRAELIGGSVRPYRAGEL
jgi:dihydroorotate dehydrogenase